MRRVKIVCTLGPASSSESRIRDLVAAGMDCARLNFSHGDHEGHAQVAARVRAAAAEAGRPVALLGDLSGPKMRVGRFAGNGEVELVEGRPFVLTTRETEGTADRVSVSYAALPRDVRQGNAVLLDDGLLRLRVDRIEGEDVMCTVEVGGILSNNKGLNLPGATLSTPALTDKDRKDLAFAKTQIGVDFLALSFVRRPDDVAQAQQLAGDIPVIAKIEKPEALENLAAIIEVADGLMVARGDLGVELGPEKVPMVQKDIIREVNAHGKLVITATQMLDSMIRNPRPTRAEAADVANAVLDGTDAVMLSGETASGRYPLEAVRMMDAIVREAEGAWLRTRRLSIPKPEGALVGGWDGWELSNAASRAAALLSAVLPLRAIIAFSQTGRSAGLLSEYRPLSPIVAITPDPRVANRLALEWGILPRVLPVPEDMEQTVGIAAAVLLREDLCAKGEPFAVVASWPPASRPNLVTLHHL